MKIAIYARVSTDEQTVENQIRDLSAYCQLKGWTDIIIFKDEGISGSKISRPEFDKMLRMAKNKEIQTILVWKFDRASRSTKHLITLLEDFNSWGVDFVSLKENIDTSTPAGRLMYTMISAFAQFERDTLIERTKSGMSRAKAEGKHIGRTKQYDWQSIQAMHNNGQPTKEIADHYNMSQSQVRKILKKAA